MEEHLAEVRGLRFRAPVPIVFQDSVNLTSLENDRVTAPVSAEKLRDRVQVGQKIGLYYSDGEFAGPALMTTRREVAGFYDSGRGEVVLSAADATNNRNLEPLQRRVLLAHELTHALQYQNLPVKEHLEAAAARYDSHLAFNAVLEGDATFTSLAFAQGRPLSPEVVDAMERRLRDAARSETLVAEQPKADQIVEYYHGTLFVIEAYKRGGWASVNRLYSDPPRSCREIMEPDLYFERPRGSIAIDLAVSDHATQGWRESDRDTLGVIALKSILARGARDGRRQPGLSLRWSDDQMVVLKKDNHLAVIWLITFEDADAAWAFEQSYKPILDDADKDEPHRIERRDRAVLITIGAISTRIADLDSELGYHARLHDDRGTI